VKTLVTGGAGFIGSSLVRSLLEQGHDVTVLDSLLSGHRRNVEANPGARFAEGDVRDDRALATAAAGAEVIFHLAASVGNARSIAHPIEDSDINVMGTLRVLEAARRVQARKVVFSSSAGIFGELKTHPIREDHPVEPDSPCGASKLGAEKLCLAYAKLHPLEAVCLRYFNVYGPKRVGAPTRTSTSDSAHYVNSKRRGGADSNPHRLPGDAGRHPHRQTHQPDSGRRTRTGRTSRTRDH